MVHRYQLLLIVHKTLYSIQTHITITITITWLVHRNKICNYLIQPQLQDMEERVISVFSCGMVYRVGFTLLEDFRFVLRQHICPCFNVLSDLCVFRRLLKNMVWRFNQLQCFCAIGFSISSFIALTNTQ